MGWHSIVREARRIILSGLVQGVGFRPYVHRLSLKHGLGGYVRNLGGSEVEIWVEGFPERVRAFIAELEKHPPPQAFIEEKVVLVEKPVGYSGFRIMESGSTRKIRSMIPPDTSICEDCLREVLDPSSRFYGYPFHSCVRCGPRYSMMTALPYDRENTSMRDFPLCSKCVSEYMDPHNERRYHAQGISCPECGPRITLRDSSGEVVETRDPIALAARLIDKGAIVAVKGIGGYHIACLATDDRVVAKLRSRKKRARKPFALMALDLDVARRHVVLDRESARILVSREKPIVVLPRREESSLSELVAPGLKTIGVMLPYTALHYLLLSRTRDKILVMTSCNPTGEPMCTNLSCVVDRMGSVVDYILDHNRMIANRIDDSVVRINSEGPLLLRRSRGYAPRWIRLPVEAPRPVIALGGLMKNTGALVFEDKAVLTPYIGDLESPSALEDLFNSLNRLLSFYQLEKPPLLVMDKHPGYPQNRMWRASLRITPSETVMVQHHHAHALQALAESGATEGTVIAIDGTGYGDDGQVWGGEVLMVDGTSYERKARLEYQPLISGDQAIVYPARFLASYMYNALGSAEEAVSSYRRTVGDKAQLGGIDLEEYLTVVETSVSKGIAVMTSSTGRILDSFSVLLGLIDKADYDGEPAIRLEETSWNGRLVDDVSPGLRLEEGVIVIDTSKLLQDVLGALEEGVRATDIAYTVQWSLGYMLGRAATMVARDNIVYVSGGASVNEHILKGIREALGEKGLKLEAPRMTPRGDGGISLGQSLYGSLYLRSLLEENLRTAFSTH